MNWLPSIIITGLIMIPVAYAINWYVDFYRLSTEEFQGLYFAISASFAGIFLHFFKKHPKIQRKHEITIEAYELLLLMVSPMFVGLNIIKSEFPKESLSLIILIVSTFFVWYMVHFIALVDQMKSKKGKMHLKQQIYFMDL